MTDFVFQINRSMIIKQQLNTSKMAANTSVMQTRSTFFVYSQCTWLCLYCNNNPFLAFYNNYNLIAGILRNLTLLISALYTEGLSCKLHTTNGAQWLTNRACQMTIFVIIRLAKTALVSRNISRIFFFTPFCLSPCAP